LAPPASLRSDPQTPFEPINQDLPVDNADDNEVTQTTRPPKKSKKTKLTRPPQQEPVTGDAVSEFSKDISDLFFPEPPIDPEDTQIVSPDVEKLLRALREARN